MSFNCDKCGICCENVIYVRNFPKEFIENRKCKFFTKERTCAIYENRPLICNVRKFYKEKIKDKENLTLEEWEEMNTKKCIMLKHCRSAK